MDCDTTPVVLNQNSPIRPILLINHCCSSKITKMNRGRYHRPHQNHHPQPTATPPIHRPYNTTHHHPTIHHIYSQDDQKLLEEVLYLHSLWHRGPPPHLSPNPAQPHLGPSYTTHFKRKQPEPTSDKEWPVSEPKPTPDGPDWPAFKPTNQPVIRPAIGAERDRMVGLKVQLKAVDNCVGLFRRRDDGGDDDDDGEEDEEMEDDDDEEVEFFERLFEGDKELRGFYEKNWGNGEFYCLVCEVIGNKIGRKYKNGVALVQHSVSISKTKKRKAHRAYGKVVCKVLGWDIDRLPSLPIVADVGEQISVVQDEVKSNADENSAAGETTREAQTTSDQVEREDIPDAAVENSGTSIGATLVSGPTHSESERKVNPDGCNVDNSLPQQENTPKLTQEEEDVNRKEEGCSMVASKSMDCEVVQGGGMDKTEEEFTLLNSKSSEVATVQDKVVNNMAEGCSVLDSKLDDAELSAAGEDPYEELQCLPGEFQIPD